MMLPGFVEGHFHTLGPGLLLRGPDIQTDSLDEMLAMFKKYVDENPDLEFVHGWGVQPNIYGPGQPTAAMLDAIEPDRPVFFWEVGGHAAWVNSKALEMAGITAVHDFGFAGADQDTILRILKDFEKDGTLTTRVFGAYYRNNPDLDPVPLAKKLRDEDQNGLVQMTGLKINMDGEVRHRDGL